MSHLLNLKTIISAFIVMLTLWGEAEAAQQAVRRAMVLSSQAEEAAKRGDLQGTKAALAQIESWYNVPSRIPKAFLGRPEVQQSLGRTMQSIAVIHLKAAEEAQAKGDVEKAKSSLKQMEETIQNRPAFIAAPVTLPEHIQRKAESLTHVLYPKPGSSPESSSVYAEDKPLDLSNKPDNCEPLKAMGCVHMEGRCVKEHLTQEGKRICLEYEHKYKCPVTTSYSQRGIKGLPKGYCLNGDCLKTTRSSNNNMLDALSKLEALKQIQKHKSGEPITIFKGENGACTTNFGGAFKDCCGGMDGFGLSLKLGTPCSGEEQKLAAARSRGKCVFVGSFKKNKPLDMNFSKQYVYCCFPTKLSRVFQEQGRRQLGVSWGDAEHPDCRGLTVEELQRIDMSRINFSEVFAEIAQDIAKSTQHLKQFMTGKQKAFAQENAANQQKKKQEDRFVKSKQGTQAMGHPTNKPEQATEIVY
jgi:hypothetical protein